MSKEKRLELIEWIQEKRNSYVITYILSDRPNVEGNISPDAVREMYNLLCELKPFDKKKELDLFICARRGDNAVPWQIAGMIRELFSRFNVIVPYKAHSAATMIALGADKIIMGERGELSPIDIAVTYPQNARELGLAEGVHVNMEDVTALISLLESIGKIREKQRIDAFLRTAEKFPPLFLGSMNKAVEQAKTDCLKLLKSRKRRFGPRANKKIIRKLFSDFSSPHRCISRSEAIKELGLKQVKQDEELEPVFWELFTLYEGSLRTNEPFYPEAAMDQSHEEEIVFREHKLAYLETTKRTRTFQHDVKLKKVRQYPPSIQFDPQITLPSFHIPSELQVTDESVLAFIQQWLESNLPGLIDACFDKLRRNFPVSAYERLDFNKRWVDE
ncbi:MAG: hypothetical protein PVG99_08620 [Desulfobacteraceae bacterium]